MLESWTSFREAIIKRFDRKIRFYVVLQKIKAWKWSIGKESFHEYKKIVFQIVWLSCIVSVFRRETSFIC